MKFIKKTLVAIACVGMFGSAVQAAPINLSPVSYDPVPDIYIGGFSGPTSFTLNIKNIVNGFRVGIDTLNSAVLSVIFRDDDVTDGDETYRVRFGNSAQTFTGSALSNGCASFCGPSSTYDEIRLNTAALADLKADGLINIAISSNRGDFNFDKATLVANVTRGTVPEPTTVALLGLGLLGVAASRRKSAKSKNA